MNKYEVVFDMLKDKILFIFERYEYNDNKTLTFKNLSFLSKTSFVIIIWSFKSIVENESNKNNFNINHFKNTLNKKRSILTFKELKKKMIKKLDFIDIIKINTSIYYYLIRNKKNKLFSLIINEIYDIFNKPFKVIL